MENSCHHKRLSEAEISGQKVGETLKILSSPFKTAALFVNTESESCALQSISHTDVDISWY